MSVHIGKFVDGVIQVDNPDEFEEGQVVRIVSDKDDEGFELSDEQKQELMARIEEADRGEVISLEDFWAEIRAAREG